MAAINIFHSYSFVVNINRSFFLSCEHQSVYSLAKAVYEAYAARAHDPNPQDYRNVPFSAHIIP